MIEPLVTEAIARRELPGAVVLAGRGNQILYKRAFGNRSVLPSIEPMTVDTIFDLASLTKVVATTTAVMLLVEDGRLRLTDRVADHGLVVPKANADYIFPPASRIFRKTRSSIHLVSHHSTAFTA